MIYRPLGRSGIDISTIGFGAWAIGGWMWGGADEDQAVAAIEPPSTAASPSSTPPRPMASAAPRNSWAGRSAAAATGSSWPPSAASSGPRGGRLLLPHRPARRHPTAVRAEDVSLPAARLDPRRTGSRASPGWGPTAWTSTRRTGPTPAPRWRTRWPPWKSSRRKEDSRHRFLQRGRRRLAGRRRRFRPGEVQPPRPRPGDQRPAGPLPHRGRGLPLLLAAGQRTVDRQDPTRPPVRAGRPAEGEHAIHEVERGAGERDAGEVASGGRAARREPCATGDCLDDRAAGRDLRAVRRPRPAASRRDAAAGDISLSAEELAEIRGAFGKA